MKAENKQNELSNEEQLLLKKLEEVSSLAPYCEKPPEGWICSLGKALGLSSSELAQKTLVSEQTLQLLEEEVPLFLQNLNQIAKVFEGKFQYVCVPNNINNLKKIIFTNDIPPPNDEPTFLEKFEHLPSLPQRPSKGWIQFMRLARGMTIQQLAKKLHKHKSTLLNIEKAEAFDELFTDRLTKIVEALGCRFEYFFIPEGDAPVHGSYSEQTLLQQLISISSLPLRPPQGWIRTMRKILGISPLQFAKKLNIGQYELLDIEINEEKLFRNFNNKCLADIAQALGCRLEYCFIPFAPLHFDHNLMAHFESFPVYNTPTHKGQLFYLRQAVGVSQLQLSKKLNMPVCQIERFEKMEAEGKIFHQHAINIVHALGCQIKYILIPEKDSLKKMEPQEALFWNELKKQADLFPRPPEGWFCYFRNSLKMTASELSIKINIDEEFIIQVEKNEVSNKIIKDPLMEMAQALGIRIEYIIFPRIRSNQDNTFEKKISNHESVEKFRKLSLLPERPNEGWIKAIRRALGLTQQEIAKHTNFGQELVSWIEKTEEMGQIISRPLEPILQILDARAELIFIPHNLNALQNSFVNKKGSLKKPRVSRTSEISPKEMMVFDVLKTLEQGDLVQKTPGKGWISIRQKRKTLSRDALEKKLKCKNECNWNIEKLEIQNKSLSQHLKKVTYDLGHHFERISPNNPFFKENRKRKLLKEFELPFEIYQTPADGWISTIRKTFGLKKMELNTKINKRYRCGSRLEKLEKKGKFTPPYLKKVAQALDCKVELLFIPEKAFFTEFTLSYQKLFKKFKKASSLPSKPPIGWIRTIRMALGMSVTKFSQRINVSILRVRENEFREIKNDNIVHPLLKKIADTLGYHVDYIFIPEKDAVAGVPIGDSQLLKKLKRYSAISERPPEGWIKAVQMLHGLTQSELARKINYSTSHISRYEEEEARDGLVPKPMKAIAQALGGRFDYRLIPISPLPSQELYKKLEKIFYSYHKPSEGWIFFIRKMRGKRWNQVAKETKLSLPRLQQIASSEAKNILPISNMQIAAEVFGGRFEYVLIPEKPFLPQDRSLVLNSGPKAHTKNRLNTGTLELL